MSSKLEIEYLDYRFTATLDITESGRVAVVDRQLESEERNKTLGWIVFDRFLARNDFTDEEDARANIVEIYAALSCVSERHYFLWWRKRSL